MLKGTGVKNVPFAGKYLNDLWGITALFPHRHDSWNEFYYFVQFDRAPFWVEVPESTLSNAHVFGNYSRLNLLLGGVTEEKSTLSKLAFFTKNTLSAHGEIREMTGFRISVAQVRCGDGVAKPKGKWVRPRFGEEAGGTSYYDVFTWSAP